VAWHAVGVSGVQVRENGMARVARCGGTHAGSGAVILVARGGSESAIGGPQRNGR